MLQVGGRLPSEDLRPFQTAMNQLGAPILTLDRLVGLLESSFDQQDAGTKQTDIGKLEHFFSHLWSIVNDLLPDSVVTKSDLSSSLQRVLELPFIVTVNFYTVAINLTYTAPAALDAIRIAELLPKLAIATGRLAEYPKLFKMIEPLDLSVVVTHIASASDTGALSESIAIDPKSLRDLYTLLADLDRQNTAGSTVYQKLRNLPIWLSSSGLVSASKVLLPGNFSDPTGQANLLDTSVLTEPAREFLSTKLEVRTQSIEAFVQTVLPTFFNLDGPLDETKFTQLIIELSNHSELLNDENICELLGSLPIVPTQDGGWSLPVHTYRRTDDLVKVLGDTPNLLVGC